MPTYSHICNIYKALRGSVCPLCSVCHPGKNNLFVPQERNISPTQERGINIFTCEEWDKHSRGGQTSYFLDGGGYDDVDVDEEMDVNEANIFVSEAIKLSTGAKIFRGL